jgi:hypothetical protein
MRLIARTLLLKLAVFCLVRARLADLRATRTRFAVAVFGADHLRRTIERDLEAAREWRALARRIEHEAAR